MTNEDYGHETLAFQKPSQNDNIPRRLALDPMSAQLLHGAIGICTENGELMDVMKRYLVYDEPIDIAHAAEEIGDVLYYVMLSCQALGLEMGDTMQANIDKLRIRYPHGFSEADAVARADKQLLKPKAPGILAEIETKLANALLPEHLPTPTWCMCTKVTLVARDGKSTCGRCGGVDAYGGSEMRPEKFKKILDKDLDKQS